MLFTVDWHRDRVATRGGRMTNDAETAARALARWLAPYLAEELGLTRQPQPQPSPLESYDEGTCAVFVAPLGDVVLDNADVFFTRLAREGEIGSLALADAIGVASPRNIAAVLTTPLKKRAKALSLPLPWAEDAHGQRTVWVNREGIAERMLHAVHEEKARRARRRAA
jgi:hypothetical protein